MKAKKRILSNTLKSLFLVFVLLVSINASAQKLEVKTGNLTTTHDFSQIASDSIVPV